MICLNRTISLVGLTVFGCVFCPVSGQCYWTYDGAPVCTYDSLQWGPCLAPDGTGGVIVAWHDQRESEFHSYDIYAQRLDWTGTPLWTEDGVVVCKAEGTQYYPRSVSDGAGGAIIIWQDGRVPGDFDIYAQRLDASGIALWDSNGVAIWVGSRYDVGPEIVADGAGGAIITWWDINGCIYAQRIRADGTKVWSPDSGVSICTVEHAQREPKIVSDGKGGAIITWYDHRAAESFDVYAQRMDSLGTVSWTEGGVPICTDYHFQEHPEIASDEGGGAVITWEDVRNENDWDIYAQRIDGSGNVVWITDGVAVCVATGDQRHPRIVSDGTGGGIITWEHFDVQSGNWDVYARRVNMAGVPLWTPSCGERICGAIGDQMKARLASDGAGGAIIVWQDCRTDPSGDLYAQHVDSTGTLFLCQSPHGEVICAKTGSQDQPLVISDGVGGIFVAWSDARDGIGDIYAQHLDGFCDIIGVPERTVPLVSSRLAQNVPNPFNPLCTIRYEIPQAAKVSLRVFDLSGSLVRTVVHAWREPGVYSEIWDGRADDGRVLPSGVYFYRLEAGDFVVTRKMVLLH